MTAKFRINKEKNVNTLDSNKDLSTVLFYQELFSEYNEQVKLKMPSDFEFEQSNSPAFNTNYYSCQPIIHTNKFLFNPEGTKTVYIADRFFYNYTYYLKHFYIYDYGGKFCRDFCDDCMSFKKQFGAYFNKSIVKIAIAAPVFLPQDIKLISEISKNIFLILNRLKVPKELREIICKHVFNCDNWRTTHKYPFGRLVKIMEQTWFDPIAPRKGNLLSESDTQLKVGTKKIRIDSSTPINYILEVLNDERKLHTYTILQEDGYLVYEVGENITRFYSLKDVYDSKIFK